MSIALKPCPSGPVELDAIGATLQALESLRCEPSSTRILDLGCLSGYYTEAFARHGFREAVGLEARQVNFEQCEARARRANLPNLRFVKDDAWNMANYGVFDVIFCGGLLYHLDRPRQFIDLLFRQTGHILILNTQVASDAAVEHFHLSPVDWHEKMRGRWAPEPTALHSEADNWSAWSNSRSFWPERLYLIQALREAGFSLVFEQFFAAHDMDVTGVDYAKQSRCVFICLRR